MSTNRLNDIFKAASSQPAPEQKYGDVTGRPVVPDDELMKFAGANPMRMIKMSAIALTCKELGIKAPPAICKQSKSGLQTDELHDAVHIDCNDGISFRIVFVNEEVDSFVFREDPAESKDVSAFISNYLDKIFMLQKLIYGEEFERQVAESDQPAVKMERINVQTGEASEMFGMSLDDVARNAQQAKKDARGE